MVTTQKKTATTWGVSLNGIVGNLVEVETLVAPGLPTFILIGLPDASLGESKDRIRAAIHSAGLSLPLQRVTTNLSPAYLKKYGSGFDLAIAVSILASCGVVDKDAPFDCVHIGELALNGAVRSVLGVLPSVLAARKSGFKKVIVPRDNEREARLVEGIDIIAVESLQEVALLYGAKENRLEPFTVRTCDVRNANLTVDSQESESFEEDIEDDGDLSDIYGNDSAVRAIIAAAAGGHHLFMVGPAGSGKTMLAKRMRAILPDLSTQAAIEVAAIRSLRGISPSRELDMRPPFQAPHHTTSSVALIGGGSVIMPGAISLASYGILFLDEAPEFSRSVLDSLRQPLESGSITIHRASGRATFPANAQLVLAANPCPCGNADSTRAECTCSPNIRRTYIKRLSGPLLDRIDIQITVDTPTANIAKLIASGMRGKCTTQEARSIVQEARKRAKKRLKGTPWTQNNMVSATWLRDSSNIPSSKSTYLLDKALEAGRISMRGYVKILRLAWTLADIESARIPGPPHIKEALFMRQKESV